VRIEPESALLFIGDSVTDCGRSRPVGEGPRGLGHGYVAEVRASLASLRPDPGVRVLNTGVSADTVRNLAFRWEADVLALAPDWLSVMIGINDVWRQFDGKDAAQAVMPDEYERVYEGLLARTRPRLKGLVLLAPYVVQDMRSDPMRRRMDEYGSIVRALAARHGALFVDAQAALDAALSGSDYTELAGDRVHPTPRGHRVLADAFLGAIGVTPRPRR
jgi:lysophospholipase L1-like esterase